MKKITLSSIAAVALFAPFAVMAAPITEATETDAGIGPIIRVLNLIGNWMFGILIAVAAIYILLAAFDFLMAKGDPTKVGAARKALTYALVAVVVAALTKGLITIAKGIASGSTIQ